MCFVGICDGFCLNTLKGNTESPVKQSSQQGLEVRAVFGLDASLPVEIKAQHGKPPHISLCGPLALVLASTHELPQNVCLVLGTRHFEKNDPDVFPDFVYVILFDFHFTWFLASRKSLGGK